MKKITTEEMRYKVPNIKNRFWPAHLKFIVICAITVTIAVILFASYLYISESRKLEPKRAFVFMCDVQDIDACNKLATKFSPTVEVYFAKYDEQFNSEEENSYYFGNIANLGDYAPEINTALIIFKSDRKSSNYYDFEYFELTESALTTEQVEQIIRRMLTR